MLLVGPAKCLHFLPNGTPIAPGDIRWPQRISWSAQGHSRDANGNFIVTSFPEGGSHFLSCSPCVGQIAPGKSCDYKFMMGCSFCPETRFQPLNGGLFKAWVNPIACRSPYDVVRACKAHVNAGRGWHKFWYAVHTLTPLLSGLGGGGAAGAAGGGVVVNEEQCRLWLQNKAPDWYSNRVDFEKANLLADGGEGEVYGIPVKFRQADALLRHYFGPRLASFPKTTGKRKDAERSRQSTPNAIPAVDVDTDNSGSDGVKRVRLELKMGVVQPTFWHASVGTSEHHSLPLPYTALGAASVAGLAGYNLMASNSMSAHEIIAESFWASDPLSNTTAAAPFGVFPSQAPDPRSLERHDFVAEPPPIYDPFIDGLRPMDSVQPAAGQLDVGRIASGGAADDGSCEGGLPMHSEQYSSPQVYAPCVDHRPVVNVLLDAMSFVDFDTQVFNFPDDLFSFRICRLATFVNLRVCKYVYKYISSSSSVLCIYSYIYIYIRTYIHTGWAGEPQAVGLI